MTTPAEAELHVDPSGATCVARPIMDRVGSRWSVLIVGILSKGDARSSRLLREIEGISQKMLTQTLRGLERDGLISRRVYAEVPVRVEYALTDTGRTLLGPLIALQDWSVEHNAGVALSQERYDLRNR